MFLIILGVLILIISSQLKSLPNRSVDMAPYKRIMFVAGILLATLGVVTSSVKQIDAGYVGVQSLFGKVQKNCLRSGLNLVNPLMKVTKLDIRTQNYTMSGVHDEGDQSGDDAIRVLTKDGLEVTIDLSVLYRVSEDAAPLIYRDIGTEFKEKIIRPISRTRIRDNAVYYDAVELYSTRRDDFQQRIFKSIEQEFAKRGLILENLLVRNISLPASVRASIESKISAEQEAQKMQFVLQKEKQEAERKRVEAQGIADYQHIISEGLTDKQLRYEQIKAYKDMANSDNAKLIVMPSDGHIILDGK